MMTQRNLVVFDLNTFLISFILNFCFYFFDELVKLFDVKETVCLLLIIQIRREYHFVEFQGAMQMIGSFLGFVVSIILMFMSPKFIYITNIMMLSARHLFVSWFSIFFCVLIII